MFKAQNKNKNYITKLYMNAYCIKCICNDYISFTSSKLFPFLIMRGQNLWGENICARTVHVRNEHLPWNIIT